jgi:DNA-binding transcriptional ArsR family regulator/uncharacterized protein YndB with AHSA1/START domain
MNGTPRRTVSQHAPKVDVVLDALGDATRRAILDRLREGPKPVVEIARGMPVGRPAISQHLKVLKEARLVTDRAVGTRRLYAVDPDGMATLRDYAQSFWSAALTSYARPRSEPAGRPSNRGTGMAADRSRTDPDAGTARLQVRVPLDPAKAFMLFTDGIDEWWPLDEGFTYGRDLFHEIHLEPRLGGRFYERFRDGEEFDIGRVAVWEPPTRVVFTWRDPAWRADTEVEVTFEADGDGTILVLTHRGFERVGDARQYYLGRWSSGWPRVLATFRDRRR